MIANARIPKLAGAVLLICAGACVGRLAASQQDPDPVYEAAGRIDALVERQLTANGEEPNAPVGDELFLRRIHLDVTGRIPTPAEARAFLDSAEPDKRSRLIDRLLDSEGRVSHAFNYFADLLRIQSRMQNIPGDDYIRWIKDAIRRNKPYDKMVRELVTAEGYIWENGAAGFYLRDPGMPLDHLANTVQIFLGTQLVCAQCHDHPYDDWSQKQYYELAAYTYGVQTRDQQAIRKYRAMARRDRSAEASPETLRLARQLVRPLGQRVHETDRKLRLPKDYQYDDAKPKSVVDPKTLFGDAMDFADSDDSRIDEFATWLTSPDNPRFTVVIANRMWQQVFGRALIEPVDDLGDSFNAGNPELMDFLTSLMIALDYDLKAFQRVLFNTRTYQRASETSEPAADKPFHFQGPVPRRLSAEQIWDSLVAMAVPDVDKRPGQVRPNVRYEIGKSLEDKSVMEVLEIAEQQGEANEFRQKFRGENQRLQREIRSAQRLGEPDKVRELRAEQSELRDKLREISEGPAGRVIASRRSEANAGSQGVWKSYPRELVRASELPSPAPPGHFLRQLGQSDRETIENASDDATVPQILTFLNGPIYDAILRKDSVLMTAVNEAESVDDKIEAAFLGVLSRRPTADEIALVRESVSGTGREAVGDVVWALINTRQFAFYH